MALGGLASGLGLILLSVTQNYVYFLLVFVGLLSLGFRAGYNNAIMPAINQWFRRHRGLAMSIASLGSPLGGMLLAPLVGILVIEMGWRASALVSGSVVLALVLPLCFFIHRSPESKGLLPDGDRPQEQEAVSPIPGESPARPSPAGSNPKAERGPASVFAWEADFTVREAMRSPSYWLLVLAVGLRNTVHSGMQFLLVPIIIWFLMGAGRSEDGQPAGLGAPGRPNVAEFYNHEPDSWLAWRSLVQAAAEFGGYVGRRGRPLHSVGPERALMASGSIRSVVGLLRDCQSVGLGHHG